MTRTSLLSYSCFFFPLVEVGLLLSAVLVEGIEEGGGGGGGGGAEVEEERPCFSFSA